MPIQRRDTLGVTKVTAAWQAGGMERHQRRTSWRVPVGVPALKVAVAGLLALLAGVAADRAWQIVVALAVVAGLVAWAARDLVAPVRLAADPAGLTMVVGFAHHRQLAWAQIERVRVDVRRRSRMLEVDTGESLYLFSRYDVDADLDEVAETLESLRTAATA